MRRILVVTLVALLAFSPFSTFLVPPVPSAQAQATYYSDLWGKSGEKWHSASRLPDFSFAGYRMGDKALPSVSVKTNVKDFGAKGDGRTDDTQAFKQAIAATSNGALWIPEGRYKISNILEIRKSNVVLRGAGEGKTVLVITRSLGDVLGSVPYQGSAFLKVNGQHPDTKLATVQQPADRGERTLVLSSTTGIKAGQMVRLRMQNPPDNSLGCYLYADQGCLTEQRQSWFTYPVSWSVQVQSVQGNTITLARPLRWDVRLKWNPGIWKHQPTVREVGIEKLSIQFPNVQYGGHDNWAGYYAIVLRHTFNSWIRHVTIADADRGIEITGGGHNTVTQVTLGTKWRSGSANPTGAGTTGHYGFAMTGVTQDNLVSESEIRTVFDHNMSVATFANGNVFSGMMSETGRLDHHGAAPYENLYTEIVLTDSGRDLFKSGGNRSDEPNSGARTTFWNVVTLGSSFPGSYNTFKYPQLNVIGIDRWETKKTTNKEWIERWPGTLTSPLNLYEAQLRYRQNHEDDDVPLPPSVVEDADTDGDGLSDDEERSIYGTDPTRADTDGDGLSDGAEIDFWGSSWKGDADSDGLINLLDPDADNDGVRDGVEHDQQTDPASPSAPASGDTVQLWFEAEASDSFTAPMQVASDSNASGNKYIWVPNGAGLSGTATYHFSVPTSGTYVVWGRVIANNGSDDSFFIKMDNGTQFTWPIQRSSYETWGWDTVSQSRGAEPMRFTLKAGNHTLLVKQREDGTKLDKLLITNDLSLVPSGLETPAPAPAPTEPPVSADSSAPASGDTVQLWFEAEASDSLTAPMRVASDSRASGGQYIWVPDGVGWYGEADYDFSVPTSGTYVIWGRVISNSGSADSFFVRLNDGDQLRWDTQQGGRETWVWDQVGRRSGADPVHFTLKAGSHTLTVKNREDGTKLDKLLITNDLSFVP